MSLQTAKDDIFMPSGTEETKDQQSTNSMDPQVRELIDKFNTLPKEKQQAVARDLTGNVPPPDQKTSNNVWIIVIWAFVIIMVGAALVLCLSVFFPPAKDGTKPEMILTVFTTITAFLAGLFAPSPVSGRKDDA
ncbi:MAG: hypothetical protein JNK90_02795 [Planctomycetaceae bacterium]|nr:hypothetical protein [Planctomycetaceae bacterium]